MTKERFAEILKEYEYSENQIELLWNTKPYNFDVMDEQKLRETAKHVTPIKDTLIQA